MKRHLIPAAPFADIIRNWLDSNAGRTIQDLAQLSGLNERRLFGIRTGEHQNITFATADRLLTRLDLNDRWYSDLAPYYQLKG